MRIACSLVHRKQVTGLGRGYKRLKVDRTKTGPRPKPSAFTEDAWQLHTKWASLRRLRVPRPMVLNQGPSLGLTGPSPQIIPKHLTANSAKPKATRSRARNEKPSPALFPDLARLRPTSPQRRVLRRCFLLGVCRDGPGNWYAPL